MNIIFFGSSQFAVVSLKALLETGHKISCVVTQPDREKGRGLHLEGTPVKACALGSGLEIYQPSRVNTSESIKFLKGLSPDLFVVIAYGQILSKDILQIPKIFAINAHASILPKYRGAAPINWALINGDKKTGVTIIKMEEKMDAGPIISKREIDILEQDSAVSLESKLSSLAADALLDTLNSIENNDYELIPQDENKASFAPKLKKENGLIVWERPAKEVYNLVKGCCSWPGAFTYYGGELLKIYKAKVMQSGRHNVSSKAGEIIMVSKEGIVVATGEGDLMIEELQLEGKRRMVVEEFLAGHKIGVGERLGEK